MKTDFKTLCELCGITEDQAKRNHLKSEQLKDILKVRSLILRN